MVSRYLLIPFLALSITACSSKSQTIPPTPSYAWDEINMGVDLSYVNQLEDNGAVFRDSGKQMDPFVIFKNHGANMVRVRLWHSPDWYLPVTGGKRYSDLADVEKTIRRAKAAGMAVNLDFHYSDDWADPSKQETPKAWAGLSLPLLKDSLYNYTLSVLQYLASKNLTPEMVQIGNETNPGMCFPNGKVVGGNYSAFGELLKSGIKAVRDFSAGNAIKPKIVLHVAQLQDAPAWAKGVITQAGVTDFDYLGISHYCKWSTVNTWPAITDTIRKLVTAYQKPVIIVETAYPFTKNNQDSYNNLFGGNDSVANYPVNTAGQLNYMKDLTQAILDGGGKGLQYWEPAWISSPMKDRWGTGSSWENNALFDFNANALQGMNYMNATYKK